MAQRRMFSLKVINSARFLKMPIDAQNLYFHLGLRADDDGVVEAFSVMRLIGSTDDNLKLLHAKGFVYVLNDDLVTFITDWKEHNNIRADRKIDSVYKNLLVQIMPDVKLLEPKDRADRNNGQSKDRDGTSRGQSMDGIGKDRLGKDRLIKEKKKIVVDFSLLVNSYTENEELRQTIFEFIEYRKSAKSPMTELSVKKMLNALDKHTNKIDVLNQSIVNGWSGIFPLKNENQQKQGNSYDNMKI